jgi:hypothetical protein
LRVPFDNAGYGTSHRPEGLELWGYQLGQCWIGELGTTPRLATCGHDLSLEHAVTDDGLCRACLNQAILARRAS